MIDTRLITSFIILLATAARANAHSSSSSDEEYPEHECGVRFKRYDMDYEPATHGVYAGEASNCQSVYIALTSHQSHDLTAGPLQLNPPGITVSDSGRGTFVSTIGSIWFLRRRKHHWYVWEKSQNGDKVDFAIDFGTNSPLLFGRLKKKCGKVFVGVVSVSEGKMVYVDANGGLAEATKGYEVLTCRSWYSDSPTILPRVTSPIVSTGCVNSWLPYNNDDAPATQGVSAGEHDCGNVAYVGKGTDPDGAWQPGRIQTVNPSGFYAIYKNTEVHAVNGSFFLEDNPNYTYKWVVHGGKVSSNAVNVRSGVGSLLYSVARVRVDGHYRVGRLLGNAAEFFHFDGRSTKFYGNFEVLTCDPIPKYQCSQKWKSFIAASQPPIDGFTVGTNSNITVFIGRGRRSYFTTWDYGVGRLQVSPPAAAGVYFFDDLTAAEIRDNTTAEYLVKNPNDTYTWQPSINGLRLPNAIEVQRQGHRPFHIGMIKIDGDVFVGKVKPGVGLIIVDRDGSARVFDSYSVLTCFSPDPTLGVHKQQPEGFWNDELGCPSRKEWSYDAQKCVCMEKYRHVFTVKNAVWNEELCAYIFN